MKHQFIVTPYVIGKEKPILKSLQDRDWILNDPGLFSLDINSCIREVHTSIKDQVVNVLQQNKIPISISGDCLTAIAVMAGLQKCGISPMLLWLDAHGDFNTEKITISGFLGGMPLAKITGRGDQQHIQSMEMINLPDNDVVLADGRDLDPAEKELIESSGIHWLKNINEIKQFNFNNRPVYIHFDTDIINSAYTTAILYPVPGGPKPDELADLFQYLSLTQNICAVSVTPWEQSLDNNGRTGKVCMKIISSLYAN